MLTTVALFILPLPVMTKIENITTKLHGEEKSKEAKGEKMSMDFRVS